MTLAELRAKLKRATPAKWDYGTSRRHEGFVIGTTFEDRRYDHVAFGMTGPDASLVCAMHAALPALLDIVERVAKSRRMIRQTESDDLVCAACGAFVVMQGCMEYDAAMGEESVHDYSKQLMRTNAARIPHEDDCFLVAARKLVGKT